MQTKVILSILFLISSLWFFYRHNPKKNIKTKLLICLSASIPVILYIIFGGNVWFYSFIVIIIWMSGFYFGEIIMWWGIWVLTIGSTFWHLGILGPLLTSYLLFPKKNLKD